MFTKPVRVVGIEAANSYVKIRSAKGSTVYLNTLRALSGKEEELRIDITDKNESRPDKMVFGYEGKSYVVADPLYSSLSTARDEDRYSNPNYKLAMLLGIAQHVENGDRVFVITGVPGNHYKNEVVERTIREQLFGVHTVIVNGEPRKFQIVDVKSILQPMGTIYSLIANEDGTYTEHGEELMSSRKKIVIDIGFGSTDVAKLDEMTLIDYYTVNVSMVDVYKYVLDRLNLTGKLGLLEVEQLLRKGEVIRYGGRTFDNCFEVHKEALEVVANNIMSEIKANETLSSFDFVVFSGGGVEALYNPLKPHLVGVPNAVKVGDAQTANAEGYYLYGLFS